MGKIILPQIFDSIDIERFRLTLGEVENHNKNEHMYKIEMTEERHDKGEKWLINK